MSLRTTLRTAVLTTVATGAVLLPSAAAVADGTPTPVPTASVATPAPASEGTEPSATATPAPAESLRPGTMPRGGVDAGERPVRGTQDTALYGSAAGAVLLAGAGALVLRRRSAAQRNG
ncbi:hypothetical protein [Streptomyces sp. NPDC058620]|uniref:hypothetical protein n=1 Tax=Streptomyces sp. NPDC058620 TaxID=3346560 RepID=UPI0036604753